MHGGEKVSVSEETHERCPCVLILARCRQKECKVVRCSSIVVWLCQKGDCWDAKLS